MVMVVKPDKCIFCGRKPKVVDMGDLVYIQCVCGKWNPYEFCGIRPANSIKQWNIANCRQLGKRVAGRGVVRK